MDREFAVRVVGGTVAGKQTFTRDGEGLVVVGGDATVGGHCYCCGGLVMLGLGV